MTLRSLLIVFLALAVPLLLLGLPRQSRSQQAEKPNQDESEHSHADHAEHNHQAEQGVVESMSSSHVHKGPHFKWSAPRPQTPQDVQRAEAIVKTLRGSLEKYQDYQVAIDDGYRPFLANLPLPEYHFTNYRLAFLKAFRFDPSQPTSLLYKKTGNDSYELVGAMYTASRLATEDDLNARIPLSVARWHAHVNICLPQPGQGARADWKKFGPQGSIATEDACQEADGRWVPQLFGWMVHVYPFEDTPEKIWTHH
jgi:hypothetical protein